MKKTTKLFSILLLITIIFSGCASDESNSKKVAREFGTTLYTVDGEKVDEYKKMVKAGEKIALTNLEITRTGGVVPLPQEYIKMMQSADKNIQSLMTPKAYESIMANRFNTLSAEVCAKGNYTLEVTDFILDDNLYDEKEEQAGYYYEAKLKFISNDGKDQQTDTANGYIGLLKENGQWKVDFHNSRPSTFYKEILSNNK